jgi:pimeloyl-ACP methyl ester carboxylesterase
VTGPIVLVGHSLGGLLNRIYTGLYPEQVVGVVMLDASHPDQFANVQAAAAASAPGRRAREARGFQAGGPPPPEMAPIEAMFADMPGRAAAEGHLHARDPRHDGVGAHGPAAGRAAGRAVARPGRAPGRGAVGEAGQAAAGAEGAAEVQRRWPEYQLDHAALSTRGRVQLVEGAAHMTLVLLPLFVQQIAQAVDLMMAELGWSR